MKNEWNIKLYTSKDKEWLRIVELIDADAFYLPEYFSLFEDNFKYEAELFFYGDRNNFIIFPYLKKKINNLIFFEGDKILYDITNVEYGGPLTFLTNPSMKSELVKNFMNSFRGYCKNNNIISEFTRLHPFFKNHELIVESEKVKSVYYINLKQDLGEIKSYYDKKCRNSISKAVREKVTIKIGSEKEDILEFYKLYLGKMKEFNAPKFYHYSEEYMLNLLIKMNKNSNLKIFSAYLGDKLIASSIFIGYKGYAYYYLSCSDRSYSKYYGNNLIIDKAIEWGKSIGYENLVLGGYYKDESLAKFKSSFTNLEADFYRYQFIHNQKVYDSLVKMRKEYDKKNDIICDYKYFPEYRAGLE